MEVIQRFSPKKQFLNFLAVRVGLAGCGPYMEADFFRCVNRSKWALSNFFVCERSQTPVDCVGRVCRKTFWPRSCSCKHGFIVLCCTQCGQVLQEFREDTCWSTRAVNLLSSVC